MAKSRNREAASPGEKTMPKQEITVALDGSANILSPESVATVLTSIVVLLKSIDSNLWAVAAPRYRWSISRATMKSPLTMTLSAISLADGAPDADVVGVLVSGLEALDAGTKRAPRAFGEKELGEAKKLVSVYRDSIASITLSVGSKKVSPTSRIADHADRLTRASIAPLEDAYGSIEGVIRRVTVDEREEHEASEIQIIDRMSDAIVECRLEPELAAKLGALIRHRVILYGNIRYENAIAKRIKVEAFDEIPEHAPTLEEIHKLGVSITRGSDARDFLDELRGQ